MQCEKLVIYKENQLRNRINDTAINRWNENIKNQKNLYFYNVAYFFVKSAVKNKNIKIKKKTVLHAHDFEIFVQELFPSMLFLLLESRNVFLKKNFICFLGMECVIWQRCSKQL